ncbi:MAG: peptide-methionine (S)-S-oxide reductase MsrA [Deltaproteobacteria bacterium]|nr:peptide-methionine (S)-S-oxide reductase MsrA [Deltaproteobacteria bacterium]
MSQEKVYFGAGCFWGVQSLFDELSGVIQTTVGYQGGHTHNPTYEDVCTDQTGHAEVVEVVYDSQKISFEKLLETFFKIHDPTTPHRQGVDVGSQYRSLIFYINEDQKEKALSYKEHLEKEKRFKKPIVTQILKAGTFYKAEEYHQKYHEKHGGGCHL